MLVLDITNPLDPVQAGLTGVPSSIESIAVSGPHVFASSEIGIWSIDVSNPSRPEIVDYEPTVVGARTIVVEGVNGYVKMANGGVAMMDLTDPTSMTVYGAATGSGLFGYSDYGSNNIATFGDYVFYLDRGVLVVSPQQCRDLATTGESPVATSPAVLRQNYPNPFNPSTTIAFELAEEQPVSLRIYDIKGRLVRILMEGEVTGGGPHLVTWQGKDQSGRSVAAGTYLYRMEAGEFTELRKMTIVK